MYLSYMELKEALFEEMKPFLVNRPYVIAKWEKFARQMTEYEQKYQRPTNEMASFGVLYYLFAECIYFQMPISRSMVKKTFVQHEEVIRAILVPFFRQEFPNEEIRHSKNEQAVDEALGKEYIYTSMDTDWHLMREMFAKNDFESNVSGVPSAELVDGRGVVRGVAELRVPSSTNVSVEQQGVWDELVTEAIHSLDDLTADLFDIVSYLWMVSPRTHDGYLEFHSDDALKIRNIRQRTVRGKEVGFREEDRFNIMKRIVALSSIWVSLGEGKVKIIEANDTRANELYQFRDYQKMFDINEVRMAYSKETGEPVGVYAVKIKPAPLLTQYLDGAKKSLGILDLRSFQYNPRTQKPHKRLTRYLAWQFKIRSIRRNYSQPFKVSTFLRVMDLRDSFSGEEMRTRFEETLDDLQRDGVIKDWIYENGFDEGQVGQRGWIKNYFSQKQIIVIPPEEVTKLNGNPILLPTGTRYTADTLDKIMGISLQNRLLVEEESRLGQASEFAINKGAGDDLPKRIRNGKQKVFVGVHQPKKKEPTPEPLVVTPLTMKREREKRGVSIRQASKEMGISHTTLSRYENRDISKLNQKNENKMHKWLRK